MAKGAERNSNDRLRSLHLLDFQPYRFRHLAVSFCHFGDVDSRGAPEFSFFSLMLCPYNPEGIQYTARQLMLMNNVVSSTNALQPSALLSPRWDSKSWLNTHGGAAAWSLSPLCSSLPRAFLGQRDCRDNSLLAASRTLHHFHSFRVC